MWYFHKQGSVSANINNLHKLKVIYVKMTNTVKTCDEKSLNKCPNMTGRPSSQVHGNFNLQICTPKMHLGISTHHPKVYLKTILFQYFP